MLIRSRDNPLLVRLRKLSRDPGGYRKLGLVWLEGDHLCRALRERQGAAQQAVLSEGSADDPALRELADWAPNVAIVPDQLFGQLSTLESPGRIGFVLDLPPPQPLRNDVMTLVLDRVQDAGNVGSMLRSAAALGVRQVAALKGTAALWSPKVLRAGMGAHFGLSLHESLSIDDLAPLSMPWIATSSHAADALPAAALPSPCAWFMGHEGQGVAPELMARCALTVRIPQPGGEESLNVAAAAAICLYESARRRAG